MATLYADFVKETSSAPGSSTFTLAGAVAGFQAFSAAFPGGGTVAYSAQDGTNWEVGLGTYTVSGTTLTRTVLSSSNSNAAVNFTGTTTVECVLPAETIADIGLTTTMASHIYPSM
jgi:hypothetical protein